MARGVGHDPAIREAAIAALLVGQSVSAVAKQYQLPEDTVWTWKKQTRPLVSDAPRREKIGDLILDNLEANLVATKEIVTRVSTDAQWLKEQSASELAVFVGVLYDKTIRILEALPEPESGAGGVLAAGEGESEAAGG